MLKKKQAAPTKNVQNYDHWQIVIPIWAEEVEEMPKSVNRVMLARDLNHYGWHGWHVAKDPERG